MSFELDEMEVASLRAGERLRAQWLLRYRAHPDCRDPDHPGCDRCDDTEPEPEDDE